MTTKYGFPSERWSKAKEELRLALVETAGRGATIAYSEVVVRVEAVRLEPDSFALAHMLGELSEEENSAGRGMLSVVVVHKDGDMQPGQGFYQLAKKLGRDTSDKTTCWVEELRRVHGACRGSLGGE
jgi:hypothetical protein